MIEITACCSYMTRCPIYKHMRRTANMAYIATYCQGEFTECERHRQRVVEETPASPAYAPQDATTTEAAPPTRS
jgi:hypothetical protein